MESKKSIESLKIDILASGCLPCCKHLSCKLVQFPQMTCGSNGYDIMGSLPNKLQCPKNSILMNN